MPDIALLRGAGFIALRAVNPDAGKAQQDCGTENAEAVDHLIIIPVRFMKPGDHQYKEYGKRKCRNHL